MQIEIALPSMGEGVHEATIVKWLVEEKQFVKEGEPLLEVSTDKVDTEIMADKSGYVVKKLKNTGDVVLVGHLIGLLSDDQNAAPQIPASAATGNSQPSSAKDARKEHSRNQPRVVQGDLTKVATGYTPPTAGSFAGLSRVSPLALKLARDLGINIHHVKGSGLDGRITKDDVLAAYQDGAARVGGLSRQEPSASPPENLHGQKTTITDGKEFLEGVPVRREKMSKIRRLTAEHMLRSVKISPHVTTTFEMDLHELKRARESLAATGKKLTYTAYFIHYAAKCLELFPEVNASVDNDELLFREEINIACAVAVGNELVVPVIRRANHLSLEETGEALANLTQKARTKDLKPSDIKGGTFTVTNPGMYGSIHSQPIISQPQVAILSIGAIIERPMVVQGQVAIRPISQFGLTFDHRVIDGRVGALFLGKLKEFLES